MNRPSIRSKDLDQALKDILKKMISEGVSVSPIRNGTVFSRLAEQYDLTSKATLSKPLRREMIAQAAALQLELAGLSKKQASSILEKKNRKDRIADLANQINHLEGGLAECLETTLSLIRVVEQNSAIPVERLLGPALIKARKTSKISE